MKGPCLIADIGGTNLRLAIAQHGSYDFRLDLKVADHADFVAAASFYQTGILRQHGLRPISAALAVPGPVSADVVKPTNLGWTFSRQGLRDSLGLLDDVYIVNDFEATAMGVRHLAAADRAEIGGSRRASGGPIAVIGPGTGLGVAGLIPVTNEWMPVSSEGGHSTMSATNPEEGRILDWLRDKHRDWEGHVSAERVLSGPGLVYLYQAVCAVADETPIHDKDGQITAAAAAGNDKAAAKTLDLFCAMLGTVAGNIALVLGATGGVYIAGGIVPRVRARFETSQFRERFEQKGRLRTYLQAIATYLVLHDNPALVGLARYAERGLAA
jgi:glucokinase